MNNTHHKDGLHELYLRNMMFLSWITAIFITPFAFYSLFIERYIIFLMAVAIVTVCVINGLSIHKKRVLVIPYYYWFGIILTELAFLSATIGIKGLLWCYPFIFTIYFVQERKLARRYCLFAFVFFIIAINNSADAELILRFAVTLIMMILMSDAIISELIRMEDKLRELTIRDPLTNAHNRRYMNHILEITIEETRREFGPASLIILDIDDFKKVNDKHGHVKGDTVLVNLVELLHKRQRKLDFVFRSGGEEFVLILRNTDLQQALSLAESIRTNVEETALLENESITISLGVAEYQTDETEVEWLNRADELLYEAKRDSRNCVRPAVLKELYS